MLYTWARGDWISSWEDQVTVKHTRLDQLNGISRTTFTWRRELVGSERRVSGYKNWLFFFLIIEVLGAIHTGYTQFQSLGSGAAVSQARSRWDDRGLIGLGDDQLTPSLPNRPTAYLASYPQDKFILATCFFFSVYSQTANAARENWIPVPTGTGTTSAVPLDYSAVFTLALIT